VTSKITSISKGITLEDGFTLNFILPKPVHRQHRTQQSSKTKRHACFFMEQVQKGNTQRWVCV